jgi:hypothetical protein
MINQDVTFFYGTAQAVYRDFGGVVLSEEEGKKLAAALGPKGKGLILQNHGLLVSHHLSHSIFIISWCHTRTKWTTDRRRHRRRSSLPLHADGKVLRRAAPGRRCCF